jgi:hypothetical protein
MWLLAIWLWLNPSPAVPDGSAEQAHALWVERCEDAGGNAIQNTDQSWTCVTDDLEEIDL